MMTKSNITNLFFILITCLIFGACTATKEHIKTEDPNEIYNKATMKKNSGDLDGAYNTFISIWQNYPKNSIAPDALFAAASIMESSNSTKAIELYESLLKYYPGSNLTAKAKEHLFLNYLNLKKYTDASKLLLDNYAISADPMWLTLGLTLVNSLLEAKKYDYTFDLISKLNHTAKDQNKSEILKLWKSTLDKINDAGILSKYEEKVDDHRLLELLLAREAEIYTKQGGHEIAKRIMDRLGNIPLTPAHDQEKEVKKYTIGVLIPITGKWESVGQKILKGIESACNVFSAGKTTNIEYIIRDYGSDENKIPEIIKELDTNDKVLAVIGPIGERAGGIACNEIQKRGIPSIIFTQAELGSINNSFCYRNFLSIDIQVKTLLEVASRMNITTFATLYPTDHFGDVFSDLFEKMAPEYGIRVVKKLGYTTQNVDYKQQVLSLLKSNTDKKRDSSKDIPLKTQPEFEALLIPDTAINAAMIASYLSYYNMKGIKLFGPSLWDNPDFIRVGGKNVEGAIFVSGFFLKSQLKFIQEFNDSFYYSFGYSPSVWEASAYDTATILQNLLEGQGHTRNTLREQIASLKDYPGLTGETSFFTDGSLEKVIFVLTVKGENIVELTP